MKGTTWNGHSWRVRIKVLGKTISLGTFTTTEKANKVYDENKKIIFSFGKEKFLSNSNIKNRKS